MAAPRRAPAPGASAPGAGTARVVHAPPLLGPLLTQPVGRAFQPADPLSAGPAGLKGRMRARLPGKIARPTMYTDRVMTNPITRRQFARHLALAATGSALARYHALAAPEKGHVKIRDMKIMMVQGPR